MLLVSANFASLFSMLRSLADHIVFDLIPQCKIMQIFYVYCRSAVFTFECKNRTLLFKKIFMFASSRYYLLSLKLCYLSGAVGRLFFLFELNDFKKRFNLATNFNQSFRLTKFALIEQ